MTPVPLLFIAHKPLCFSSLPSIHNILAHLSGAVVAFQSLPYCKIVDLPYQKITLSRSHHLIGTLGYRCILPNKHLMGIWRGEIRSFSSLSGKHFYSQSLHNSRDLFSTSKKPCGDTWIFLYKVSFLKIKYPLFNILFFLFFLTQFEGLEIWLNM